MCFVEAIVHCWQWIVLLFFVIVWWWVRGGNQRRLVSHVMYYIYVYLWKALRQSLVLYRGSNRGQHWSLVSGHGPSHDMKPAIWSFWTLYLSQQLKDVKEKKKPLTHLRKCLCPRDCQDLSLCQEKWVCLAFAVDSTKGKGRSGKRLVI